MSLACTFRASCLALACALAGCAGAPFGGGALATVDVEAATRGAIVRTQTTYQNSDGRASGLEEGQFCAGHARAEPGEASSRAIAYLRESLYRLCEARLNNRLTPTEYSDMMRNVLREAAQLIRLEMGPEPARAATK